ncbi:hypothetical protein C7293_04835 [filamentous cyanobacterium CCT1]|nr:hypothetical protein C7293_04835 [filamentous cyanobacterium CCT1]PSN79014.1 hypothetical protein C8B47_13960 [filamentous cyanobacterium CCP4]
MAEVFRPLSKPRPIRWRGRSFQSEHVLILNRKKFLVIKSLSSQRRRYMVFDRDAGPQGDMRCVIEIDRQNLSTKIQTPGLVEKLKRLTQSNTNLPAIISYHPVGAKIYLVTPWIDGETLERYLARIKKEYGYCPSVLEVCKLIRGLAHGLMHLHAINLVHGDLNPNNLILQRNPTRLVMIDFGSAWLVEYTVRREKGDGNDCKYVAPELNSDTPFVDFRNDQFSLGVLFYRLLTLEVPYDNYGGMVSPATQSFYRSPSSLKPRNDKTPAEAWRLIDRIIQQCLQPEADKRYQTDREMLEDFEDLKEKLRPRGVSTVNEIVLKTLNLCASLWRRLSQWWSRSRS